MVRMWNDSSSMAAILIYYSPIGRCWYEPYFQSSLISQRRILATHVTQLLVASIPSSLRFHTQLRRVIHEHPKSTLCCTCARLRKYPLQIDKSLRPLSSSHLQNGPRVSTKFSAQFCWFENVDGQSKLHRRPSCILCRISAQDSEGL